MSAIQSERFERATKRIATGLIVRYGSTLFLKTHESVETFAASLAKVFSRAGVDAETTEALAVWLQGGLRQFSEFPPQIEVLLHLAYLIRSYPVTEDQRSLAASWYSLDTEYSQLYFTWKDRPLDEIARERVWLTKLAEISASQHEIQEAKKAILDSGMFRQYPPTIEQFKDAILAIRKNAPIAEVAWIEATSRRVSQNPYVTAARSQIGTHDLTVHSNNRDVEARFIAAYRAALQNERQVVPIGEDPPKDARPYLSREEALAAFSATH